MNFDTSPSQAGCAALAESLDELRLLQKARGRVQTRACFPHGQDKG